MSEKTRAYQLIIYDTDETTPDLTIDDADIVGVPEYGGWDVRELEGSSTSDPFTVEVLDTSEQVSTALADANGRLDLIGRLWGLKVNADGGGLATVAQGRVKEVQLATDVSNYRFVLSDERFRERQFDVGRDVSDLGSTTTQIFPPGTRVDWFSVPGTHKVGPVKGFVAKTNANEVLLNIPEGYISSEIFEWLQADLSTDNDRGSTGGSDGHFTHLRANTDGTDREVLGFSANLNAYAFTDLINGEGFPQRLKHIWIAWPSHGLNVRDRVDVYLHAPTAPVSETVPYHIGGDINTGQDMISWLKSRYDDAGIRYDSNIFGTYNASTNPNGLIDHPDIPRLWVRLDKVYDLDEIADRIYQRFGLAPFPNASGEIAPRFVLQPTDVDPTGLTTLDDSDFREPHPTFQQRGSDAITVVGGRAPLYERIRKTDEGNYPADRVAAASSRKPKTQTLGVLTGPELTPVESDRTSDLGRRVHSIELLGRSSPHINLEDDRFAILARRILDRYQDGPVRGTFFGLTSMDDVLPGEYIVVDAALWPDPVNQSRGGPRVVQVVNRRFDPFGRFEVLDAGPDDQALTAPSVSLGAASNPKHAVDATISSLPAAADRYVLEIQKGSGHWEHAATGTANETVTITGLPSGTQITGRVQATAEKRINSAWSATSSHTTESLDAPTGLSGSVDGGQVTMTWTNNETDYPVFLSVDSERTYRLPVGSSRWVVQFDDTSQHTIGVKSFDQYGGESAETTANVTPQSQNQLRAPTTAYLLQGELESAPAYPPDPKYGVGVDWGVWRGNPGADLVCEYDTTTAFSSSSRKRVFSGNRARIELPADGVRRYFRFRLEREGFLDSQWTDPPSSACGGGSAPIDGVYTAIPVPFAEEPPENINENFLEAVEPEWKLEDNGSGTLKYFLDFRVRPRDRVTHIKVLFYAGGGTYDANYEVALSTQGEAEVFRLQESDGVCSVVGDLEMDADATSGTLTVIPFDGTPDGSSNAGLVADVDVRDPTASAIGGLRTDVDAAAQDAGAGVSGSWTPDRDSGATVGVTLSGNATLQAPSNFSAGQTMVLRVDLNGNTLSFASSTFEGSFTPGNLSGIVWLSLAYDDRSGLIGVGVLNSVSTL